MNPTLHLQDYPVQYEWSISLHLFSFLLNNEELLIVGLLIWFDEWFLNVGSKTFVVFEIAEAEEINF